MFLLHFAENWPESTNQPESVFHDEPAVSRDPAFCPCVDDEVPMQGRSVDSTGLGVALTEREVDGPADLFVEENAAGEPVDPGVESESELAEPACSGVEVEHREQIIFSPAGACGDDSTLTELETDSDQSHDRHGRQESRSAGGRQPNPRLGP